MLLESLVFELSLSASGYNVSSMLKISQQLCYSQLLLHALGNQLCVFSPYNTFYQHFNYRFFLINSFHSPFISSDQFFKQLFIFSLNLGHLNLNLGFGSVSRLSKSLLVILCSSFSMQLLVSKSTILKPLSCPCITLSFYDFSIFFLTEVLSRCLIPLGVTAFFSILLTNNYVLLLALGLGL